LVTGGIIQILKESVQDNSNIQGKWVGSCKIIKESVQDNSKILKEDGWKKLKHSRKMGGKEQNIQGNAQDNSKIQEEWVGKCEIFKK
jgi:hypothetical protein